MKKKKRVAFVGHPLSVDHLFYHPYLKPLKWLKPLIKRPLEIIISFSPPILYGKILGIKSQFNQKEVVCYVFGVFFTPRTMLSGNPSKVYKRLIKIGYWALEKGATILGLGGYTKIAGDAGVTVAQESPINVTNGNTLSVSSIYWMLEELLASINKVSASQEFKAKVSTVWNSSQVKDLTVMVIGATGSIGKTLCELYSKEIDTLLMVSRTPKKLQALKDELSVGEKVEYTTDANECIHRADVVVLSTSEFKEKLFDVQLLKPGTIVLDVSRPQNITSQDIQSRSDVLFVESGDLLLPGKYKMTCDIGLAEQHVYACLAESVLLALEEQEKSFEFSKSLDAKKVIEFYELAVKHGFRLAPFTNELKQKINQDFLLQLMTKYLIMK